MITNPTPDTLLFVYGTLMRASRHPMADYLRGHSTYRGEGHFSGSLYNLGSYPGALYEPESAAKVFGEIVALTDPSVLEVLDRYEGLDETPAEYARQRVPVQGEPGVVDCWTYLYRLPVADSQRIPSGKYAL